MIIYTKVKDKVQYFWHIIIGPIEKPSIWSMVKEKGNIQRLTSNFECGAAWRSVFHGQTSLAVAPNLNEKLCELGGKKCRLAGFELNPLALQLCSGQVSPE